MSSDKKELSMEALELVSGGVLADGWQGGVDSLVQNKLGIELGPRAAGQRTFDIKQDQLRPILELTDEIASVCGHAEAAKVAMYLQDKYGFDLAGQRFAMG